MITPEHMCLMEELRSERVVGSVPFTLWCLFGALSSQDTPRA